MDVQNECFCYSELYEYPSEHLIFNKKQCIYNTFSCIAIKFKFSLV